ncbi:MAG: hypothetical protein A2X46_16450 [Lentisphaerae bacterium GWF2_57_35]|nr:MAG: hypothetical protein A2X46_16450 [Lentisphaerae bacterium GWF2_57_35]
MLLLLSSFILHPSSFCFASPPLPSFRYYGLLADEYGWPVLRGDNTVVILKNGTNECARYTANELLGNGINYILEAAIDNATGARYAPYALRQGETVTVSVVVNGIEQTLMGGSSLPVVGNPGAAVRVDLNLGTDVDGDGLSDQWETALIINNSGGLYTNIYQVLPGDDFDGDQVSNQGEFGAGTAPEWADDVFEANQWMMNADGLLTLCFWTKQGLTYEIFAAPQALSGQGFTWTHVPFRTSPSSTERMNSTAAQSSRTFFYVTPTNTYKMYRLEIHR